MANTKDSVIKKEWYKENGLIIASVIFVLSTYFLGFGPIPVILALISALITAGIVIVPPVHYGVREFMGKRTGEISREGVTWIFPFLENLTIVSMELKRIAFSVTFTSKDKLEVKMTGELQYRADPNIKRDGKNVHVEISDDVLEHGISETIESKIGALGGVENLDKFIEKRHSIADYLNCYFRLSKAPHINHDSRTCGVSACTMPKDILAENVPDFYTTHRVKIKEILDKEAEGVSDTSPIEQRYGIDIVGVPFGKISFTEETKKSLEKKKQTEVRHEAFKTKMEMIKAAKELDASFQEASNAADIALEPDIAKNKKIISVEGSILGALLAGGTSGGSSSGRSSKEGKE